MLGLSYCLYSKGARLYLEKRNVDFVYIDVNRLQGRDRDEAEDVLARFSPQGELPLTVLGDGSVRIVGYDRKKLQAALGLMPLRPVCPAPGDEAEDPLSVRRLALDKLHALLDRFPAVQNVASGVASHVSNMAGEVRTHIGNVANEVKNNLPKDENDDTPLGLF
jgi:glutaredoxin